MSGCMVSSVQFTFDCSVGGYFNTTTPLTRFNKSSSANFDKIQCME